jgi:hypothetical protein
VPITAADLDADKRWSRRPLFFLNGCGTAAFSPDALSPFITKLVRDRGAAGVVGTETPVWEALAVEMAERFFDRFLDGAPAGQSLLEARLALLAQNNPLGLSYVLYAAADLTIDGSGAAPVIAVAPVVLRGAATTAAAAGLTDDDDNADVEKD